jgi:hypothetical protein
MDRRTVLAQRGGKWSADAARRAGAGRGGRGGVMVYHALGDLLVIPMAYALRPRRRPLWERWESTV